MKKTGKQFIATLAFGLLMATSAPVFAQLQHGDQTLNDAMYYLNSQKYDKANAIFWRLAGRGDASAQYYMGFMKDQGLGTNKDYFAAVRWMEKAALQGHMGAAVYMGNATYNGVGTPKDLKAAYKWYEKAANAGYAEAQNNLGTMLKKGEGIDAPNLQMALQMFVLSSNQSYPDALYNLGKMYEDGDFIAKDMKRAIELYKQGADLGSILAMNAMGDAYYKGAAGFVSPNAAIRYYFAAATHGNKDSIMSLAMMMEKSEGDPTKGPADALDWYKKADEDGKNPEAAFRMAKMFEEGRGTDKNPTAAFKYYKEAADKNYQEAKLALARMFESGVGTKQSQSEARRLYEFLALRGNPDAMLEMGRMCRNGIGGDTQLINAYMWYALAADMLEDEEKKASAVVARIEVSNNLSDGELKSARDRKASWKPVAMPKK